MVADPGGAHARRNRILEHLSTWRSDLINLARNNRLLYFRHSRASTLELAVEPGDVEKIAAGLVRGARWRFFEPDLELPREEWEPEADELVTNKEDAASLGRALRALERRAQQDFMEKGLWVLYVAVGMLSWVDPDNDERVESPILLIPVEVTRENLREPYTLTRADEDPVINPTLAIKLGEFGIDAPTLDDEDELDPADILGRFESVIARQHEWSVQRRLVVSPFSFHKEVMYRDLLNNEDAIADNALIDGLVNGAEEGGSLDFDTIPEELLDSQAAPEGVATVRDADATQRQCIAAAEDGRSFVMDGPPGTGKSQTITNIIAQLLAKGRTVLFVSEKAAALDVVSSRLRDAGIGEYALELHSHKATRKEVARELGRALQHRTAPRPKLAPTDRAQLIQRRLELSARAAALNERREPLGRTVHEAIGRCSQLHNVPQAPHPQSIDDSLTASTLSEILSGAEELSRAWGPVTRGSSFLWRDLASVKLDSGRRRRVDEDVAEALRRLGTLRGVAADIADALRLPTARTFTEAETLRGLVAHLVGRPAILPDWLTHDPNSLRELVGNLSAQANEHAQIVASLASDAGALWRDLDPTGITAADEALGALDAMTPSWRPRADMSIETLGRRLALLRRTPDALATINADAARIATAFGLPTSNLSMARAVELAELAELTVRPQRPEREWIDVVSLHAVEDAVGTLQPMVVSLREHHETLAKVYSDKALDLDIEGLQARFETVHTGLGKVKGGYRADKRLLASVSRTGKADAQAKARLGDALAWQKLAHQVDDAEQTHAGPIGSHYYRREDTDFEQLLDAVSLTRRALALLGDHLDVEATRRQLARDGHPESDAPRAAERITSTVGAWRLDASGLLDHQAVFEALPLTEASKRASTIAERHEALRDALATAEANVGTGVSIEVARSLLFRRRSVHLIEQEVAQMAAARATGIGPRYDGLATDWSAVGADIDWACTTRAMLDGDVTRPTAEALLATGMEPAGLDAALNKWSSARGTICSEFVDGRAHQVSDDLNTTFEDAEHLLREFGESVGDIDEWVEHCRTRETLVELGMNTPLEFAESQRVPAHELARVIERAVLERWIDHILEAERDRFGSLRSDQLDSLLEGFRELDERLVAHAAASVIDACNARRPTTTLGGAGVIQREAQKQRKHMPVRRLLTDAGEVAQALKPCFMMSPLTVSQFLPSTMRFDVVIFDEASQVRPGDAINCIYRGTQLIVAGDDKQLPPTSFFERSGLDEGDEWEEDQFDEFESILGLCKSSGGMRQLPLRWHYRSQHEDLITYSNYAFYAPDGHPLVTFPGAIHESPELGVALYHVPDGVYRRGAGRDNPIEAKKVAERVMEWASRRGDPVSVGVVAFSEAQATAIEAELETQRQDRRDLDAFFDQDRLGGFFVKSLENVQGDERDVMIFSIGYGRDEIGRFTMNFGPINRQGGQRRLNVAITRARRRVEVVASIKSDDFSGDIASEGVRHLKRYLDFADRGVPALSLDVSASTLDAESPFEEQVVATIRGWGYDVVPQVGVFGYRVDIGVRDQSRPGRYALGIECDGAMYHSSKVARDRDRLRQEILEGLGWKIHRIWGTAWYRDRTRQEARLREAIEAAMTDAPELRRQRVGQPRGENVEPILEEVDFDTLPAWVTLYEIAAPAPPRNRRLEMHEDDAQSDLRRMIREVADVEGPISEELALRRVREAWGVGRAGSRIRDVFSWAIQDLARQRRLTRTEGRFIAGRVTDMVAVRSPMGRPDALRMVDEVPPSELEAAVQRLVAAAIRVTRDELTREVARIFGWSRRGTDIARALEDAVDRLVARGLVREAEGVLMVGRPS